MSTLRGEDSGGGHVGDSPTTPPSGDGNNQADNPPSSGGGGGRMVPPRKGQLSRGSSHGGSRASTSAGLGLVFTIVFVLGFNVWLSNRDGERRSEENVFKQTPAGMMETKAQNDIQLTQAKTEQLYALEKLAKAGVAVSVSEQVGTLDQSSTQASASSLGRKFTTIQSFSCENEEAMINGFAKAEPYQKDVGESVTVANGCAWVQFSAPPTNFQGTGQYLLAVDADPGKYHKCGTQQVNNDWSGPCLGFLKAYTGQKVRVITRGGSVTISEVQLFNRNDIVTYS
jgi:hypothetical protein